MQAVCLDELGVVAESSGHYLFPFVAVVQHCVGGFLGGLEGMVGSPPALYFVSGGGGVELEDVAQGGLDKFACAWDIRFSDHDEVEPGLASHRPEVDDGVGMVSHALGEGVLQGVHRRHVQMFLVGLAEPHVVLGEGVASG